MKHTKTHTQSKHSDNNRCACCGVILLRNERNSGHCFAHLAQISYARRMELRAERRAAV